MHNSTRWLSRARKEFEHVYNRHRVEESSYTLGEAEKKELLQEIGNSKYTLDASSFLQACTRKHRFMSGSITIDVFSNRIGKKLHLQVARTLYRMNAIVRMFLGNAPNDFVITLIPLDEPRKKPTGNDVVEPYHINGGYTYVRHKNIYIYRLEEWPKVALHELLHNMPMLQEIKWTPVIIRKLYAMFNIDTKGCPKRCSTDLEPTEGIIEAWAIFLHTAFMSFETEGDFYRLFTNEIKWNDHLIGWILKKQDAQPDKKWREGTHAFSYLVLRGILLHNMEAFLGMPMPYNPEALFQFFEKGWKGLVLRPSSTGNRNSMRMSRYGDV